MGARSLQQSLRDGQLFCLNDQLVGLPVDAFRSSPPSVVGQIDACMANCSCQNVLIGRKDKMVEVLPGPIHLISRRQRGM